MFQVLAVSLMTLNALRIGEVQKPVCFPFGVAQPDRRTGAIFNSNKGIDAIDLLTGKVWIRQTAEAPLCGLDGVKKGPR